MAFSEQSPDEVRALAGELEVSLDRNPGARSVVNDMLRPESLPPGWEVRFDPEMARREYYNTERGEKQYSHPLLTYYKGSIFMDGEGYRQLQMNEADQPPAPQEVLDMCAYLNISPSEDPYVVEVARLAISAPLPPNWEEGEDDDGNPLFSNRATGESQPSHPLDPYFLELINRRRNEVSVRADGVGIRSAVAAKRLYEIGVPGIVLPPELQDEYDQRNGGRAEEEEEEPLPGANLGPLVTIEEAEDEGRDDDDDERKTKAAAAKKREEDEQEAREREDREARDREEQEAREREEQEARGRDEAAAAAAAAATSKAMDADDDDVSGRKASRGTDGGKEEEAGNDYLSSVMARHQEGPGGRKRLLAPLPPRQSQEVEEDYFTAMRREADTKVEEQEGTGPDVAALEREEQEHRRQEQEDEDEEQRRRQQEEEEEDQEPQRREREAAAEDEEERARREEERRRREQEEDEEEREREQRRRQQAEDDERRRRGSDAYGDGDDVDAEEHRRREREAAERRWEEEEGDRAREAEEDPGDDADNAAIRQQQQRLSTAGSDAPPPTLSAGLGDPRGLRNTESMESGISAAVAVDAMPPPDDDNDDDDHAGVTLAPPRKQASDAEETGRLVLGKSGEGAEWGAEVDRARQRSQAGEDGDEDGDGDRARMAEAREKGAGDGDEDGEAGRQRGKQGDEDEYDEDFEADDEDTNSGGPSRQANDAPGAQGRSGPVSTTASDSRPPSTSASRPGTTTGAPGAVVLAAPVTPERRPPRPTTPLSGSPDYDAAGSAPSRTPSPPAQPPPEGGGTPRGRRSPSMSRSSFAGEGDGEAEGRTAPGGSRPTSGIGDPAQSRHAARGWEASASADIDAELEAEPSRKSKDGAGEEEVWKGQSLFEPSEEPEEQEASEEVADADDEGERKKSEGGVSAGAVVAAGVMATAAAAAVGAAVYIAGATDDERDDEGEEDEEKANRRAAAAAAFDAKFPPLPVADEGKDSLLRRSRSFSEFETGRLQKQLTMMEAARNATASGADASAAAAAAAAAALLTGWNSVSARSLNVGDQGSRGWTAGGAANPAASGGGAAAARPRPPERERIRVAVRARPVPRAGEVEAWIIDPENRTVQMREGMVSKQQHTGSADRVYKFDLVLGPGSTTKQLWASHVVPLMDASLSGVNTTVFAYGQTGSGKTFTMFGSDGRYDEGAIGMSLTYLFKALQTLTKIKSGSEEYVVKISMLELYNEQLRDLLAPGGGPFDRMGRPTGPPLALQDDPRSGVRVSGLVEQPVEDMPYAMMLIERGAASRSVGSTAMNEVSSRSHTIVRLALETRDANSHEPMHTSLISFVDLAGSERLAKTGSTGARFVEGTNINISLLMLGTVVSKLAEGRVGEFIPYRNSKLTRLLQPCLGGNSKTAIIATINPAVDQLEESFNTLSFASRAMDVINQVSINSYVKSSGTVGGAISGAAAAALQKQVASLKAELAALRREGAHGGSPPAGSLYGIPGAGGMGGHVGGGGGGGVADSVLAERVAKLEVDKARLLDRLEALTGNPQGDVYDDLPPTPPDLNLPPSRPPGRSAAAVAAPLGNTPAAALRSIARLAFLGKSTVNGKPMPRQVEQIPPEEVVVAVREMRAERDELRRRDQQLRQSLQQQHERVAVLEPLGQLEDQVKDVMVMLEDILGPSPLADYQRSDEADPNRAAANQALRLAENVQAVALMHNELASLQRQVATSEATAAAAARRAETAETALQRVAAAAARDRSEGGGEGPNPRLKTLIDQLTNQLNSVRSELDVTKSELSRWRGLAEVAPEVGGSRVAPGAEASGDEGSGDGGKRRSLLNPTSFNVGSFAIKRAREALAQVSTLEARCAASEAERDELKERLQALEDALAGVPGARSVLPPLQQGGAGAYGVAQQRYSRPGSALADGGEALTASVGGPAGQQRFEQLKAHVGSLSREVSALTRERDSLLAMVLKMQAPQNGNAAGLLGGGAGAGASFLSPQNAAFSSAVPMQAGSVGALGSMGQMAALGSLGMGGMGGMWEPESLIMPVLPMRQGGSPMKLKPVRGKGPHHHHRRKDEHGGYGSLEERPDFNPRNIPLEEKQRLARIRDRASKLDAPVAGGDPSGGGMEGLGLVAQGLGIPAPMYGGREAEMFAMRQKMMLAERSRHDPVVRSHADLKNMQIAIAAANREFKEQARSHVAEMRQLEVAHEENLAAARAEAAAMVKSLIDENTRLKFMIASSGPPVPVSMVGGGGPSISGFGGGGGGGLFPMADVPVGGGARGARASPGRSSVSPGRGGHSSLALPSLALPRVGMAGGGGGRLMPGGGRR